MRRTIGLLIAAISLTAFLTMGILVLAGAMPAGTSIGNAAMLVVFAGGAGGLFLALG